jgi:peptidoglycan/LPS O-acetylase OafA/YrhL
VPYRPDIDGLRAVAVLSVIAFHLGVTRLSGGFTGVDVFFVISGFLITGLLTRELRNGTFSLIDFYRRRARRILPALVTVLLTTSAACVAVLFVPDLVEYRDSLLAATFFSSNVYFWQATDYFAAPAGEQPLLHTWSLAVEEQYYVLFPLLLMVVVRRRPDSLKPMLWLLTLVSFTISVVGARVDPGAAFYLLPSRAWELGVGALLAVGRPQSAAGRVTRHSASVVGGLFLLVGFLVIDEGMPFPGEVALLPVIGAAAVIWSGTDSIFGRLLSLGPVRATGLLSYSLYLWHWPVIVLYRALHPGPLSLPAKIMVAGLSAALAGASYLIVERPMRRLRLAGRRRLVAFVGTAVAASVVMAVGVGPAAAARPASKRVADVLAFLEPPPATAHAACFVYSGSAEGDFRPDQCLRRDPGRPNVLLLGDSHAASLWVGLQAAMPAVNVMQATASGCKPLLPLRGQPRCRSVIDTAISDLDAAGPVDEVVLVARWQYEDLARLPATISALRTHARSVVVIGPTSEYRIALPKLLAREQLAGRAGLAAQNLALGRFAVDAALGSAVERLKVEYVSQLTLICPKKACRTLTRSGIPMKFDYGHYTQAGSVEIGQQLAPGLLRQVGR